MAQLETVPETPNRFLSPRAVARLLGCSTRTVLNAVNSGRIPATRVSKRTLRIPESAIAPFTTPDSSTDKGA